MAAGGTATAMGAAAVDDAAEGADEAKAVGGGGAAATEPPSPDPSGATCAVGGFASDPVHRLAGLLSEPDAAVRRQRLREALALGTASAGCGDGAAALVEDFAATLERSSAACRRASMLWPRTGELAVSFNGGKDACVVLYLWLASAVAAASLSGAKEAAQPVPQTVIFFDSADEFPAVRAFVSWVVRSLGLRMLSVENNDFKRGMEELVNAGLRAVVMGQRRGDPWMDKVDVFSTSTDGWPAFMRINPIIDWSYGHVWLFLRALGLPYCSMYDDGYTSIGSMDNTLKNPELRRADGSYAPAFELRDASSERAGRVSKSAAAKRSGEANGAAERTNGNSAHRQEEGEEVTIPPGRAANAAAAVPGGCVAQDIQAQAASPYCSPTLRAFKSAAAPSSPPPRTAAIAVIGNEILNGKVHDMNANYLCGQLHSRGMVVKYIEVVPDDVEAIARCVQRMATRCDFVFTSGGLGPTHDDLTMEGVSRAFGECLVVDQRFHAMLAKGRQSGTGDDPAGGGSGGVCGLERQTSAEARASAHQKMASVPRTAHVEWLDDGNPWPLVSMRNVYIFTGLPTVFRIMFERAAHDGRFEGAQRWVSSSVWLDAEEEEVLDVLQQTVDEFPFVEIGSYPAAKVEGRRRLNIGFEAFDAEVLSTARARLVALLPEGVLVDAGSEGVLVDAGNEG